MALSIEKQIEELNELIRIDRDALGAYTEAIDAVREPAVRDPLTRFREDHERHVSALSEVVRRLGGKPAAGVDLKGMLRKTLTKVAGLVGAETVLKAMKSNEEAINQAYERRSTMDFPSEVRELVQRNYEDERRHLAWVGDALRSRIWEQASAHP
jgi:uncharacterized protein (TIGR02284 family)